MNRDAIAKPAPTWFGPAFFFLAVLFSVWHAWRFRYFLNYADEAENLVGGWLSGQGWRLYRDFFSHHMPLPILAGGLASRILPSASSGMLRVIPLCAWILAALSAAASPWFRARRDLGWLSGGLFLIAMSLLAHQWWGHMDLSDGIWASFMAVFFSLYLIPQLAGMGPSRWAAVFAGFFAGLALFSSHMALVTFAGGILLVWLASPTQTRIAHAITGLLLGALVMLALIARFSDLGAFWDQAIVFNFKVYPSQVLGVPSLSNSAPTLILSTLSKQAQFLRHLRPLYWIAPLLFALAAWQRALNIRQRLALSVGIFALILLGTALHGEAAFRDLFIHDAPYYTLALFLGAVGSATWIVSFPKPAISLLALAYFAFAVAELSNHGGNNWKTWNSPYDSLPNLKPFIETIRAQSRPEDRITVLNYQPIAYLLAQRLPAQDSTFYLPWMDAWDAGRPEASRTCAQLARNRPLFVLSAPYYESGWGQWGRCVKEFPEKDYCLVMRSGTTELWKRPDLPCAPLLP